MTINQDLEASLQASHWMYLWADCLKARSISDPSPTLKVCESEARGMYVRGAPNAREFRPLSDPDPMCFVFLQVENLLGVESGLRWQFAYHVWGLRRPVEEFRHPDLKAMGRTSLFGFRQRLLKRLAWQIRCQAPEWLSKDLLKTARNKIKEERRHS